jgi:hypothetical protein
VSLIYDTSASDHGWPLHAALLLLLHDGGTPLLSTLCSLVAASVCLRCRGEYLKVIKMFGDEQGFSLQLG